MSGQEVDDQDVPGTFILSGEHLPFDHMLMQG